MKISSKDLQTLVESMVRKELKLNENYEALSAQGREHWQTVAVHLNLDPKDPNAMAAMKVFMEAIKKAYTLGYETGWSDASSVTDSNVPK